MSVDVDPKGVLECDDKDNSIVFLFYDKTLKVLIFVFGLSNFMYQRKVFV